MSLSYRSVRGGIASALAGGFGSSGSSFVPILRKLAPVTGFVYDHGPNSYDPATLTGADLLIATPGLLPTLGKDDGALRGAGTVTYPDASAISGTGDFTIVALAVIGPDDSVTIYSGSPATSNRLVVTITGPQDRISVNVGTSSPIIDESHVGMIDGRAHMYVCRRTSGNVELLMDGRLIDSAAGVTSITAGVGVTTSAVFVGATLDEVAWWRRALTDTELTTLLAQSNVVTTSTGLLTGEWLDLHLTDFCFSNADLDTGWSMIDTPSIANGDAAAALAEIAQAEDGMIFVNAAGALRFIGRNNFGLSKCTIGDTVDSDIPFDEPPDWSLDVDQVYNRIQVSKDGYALVQADDLASQNAYGIRALQWSANLLEASQMQDAADWLLARYKNPRLRVDSVQVRGQGGDWPTLLALELGDRVTVNHHPPGGTLLTAEVIVEHIEYQLAPDDWTVTLQLAPLPPVMIWGDPVQGYWTDGWVWGWGEPAAA